MKNSLLFILVFLGFLLNACQQKPKISDQTLLKELSSKRVMLPNGWSLTPIGRSLSLGDLPLNIVLSASKKYAVVVNSGQSTHSLMLIDIQTERILDVAEVPKTWYGLCFGKNDTKVYLSGGNDNQVLSFDIVENKLVKSNAYELGKAWPTKISPTGICVSETQLFVVTKEDNSLYVFDLASRKLLSKTPLNSEAFACLLSKDQKSIYVSLWGASKVLKINTISLKTEAQIETQSHPNAMILDNSGERLFVANANDNSVSVINTKQNEVTETLNTALFANAPIGSTPNALCLSENQEKLFVANADNNCLAVFDVRQPGQSKAAGFVPTGWYPTGVLCVDNKILVCNGKGFASRANPKGPNPLTKRKAQEKGANAEANADEYQYIGSLFKGSLTIMESPTEQQMAVYSTLVYQNCPYSKNKELLADGEKGNPIPRKMGETSPIKYVFYIIKENRTYDQVFGDIKEGNGDESLCIFPEKITPNQHKLAKEFVLLDNFYVDAEVSADGHNWTTAAYANDYVEKTWPTNYGGRGGTYDYEGSRAIAYPKMGFIWDYCQRAGISYRTYGEFTNENHSPLKSLEGHFCKTYRGWDLKYKDVDRCKAWIKEFDELLAKNQVPRFNSLRMGNDHTSGLKMGEFSPMAAVADNDYAVGLFIEHLSHSDIWAESVVFVLEDDAQNGSDHVDAHRSNVLVISPFTKRKTVNHEMYSTAGVLRSIELILGLPAMSQYDAGATSLWKCFTAKANTESYHALAPNVDIFQKNTAYNSGSKKSATFDFSKEDAAPDLALNQIIWEAIKHTKMPAPKHAAFVKIPLKKGDDDD